MLAYLFVSNTLNALHFLYMVKTNNTQVRKPALCDVQRLVTTPTARFCLRPSHFCHQTHKECSEVYEAANTGLKHAIYCQSVEIKVTIVLEYDC